MALPDAQPADDLDNGCLADMGLAVFEVLKFCGALFVGSVLATLVSLLPSSILLICAILIVCSMAALICVRHGEWTALVGFYTSFSLAVAFWYWVEMLELWKLD
jgi:hypothetical protein